MRTTEADHSTEDGTLTSACEAHPPYDSNGQADGNPSSPSTGEAAGSEPRPVTAQVARRQRLCDSGILVLQEKSLVLGPIDETLRSETIHSNPRRKPEEIRLRPGQELVFVPSGSEEATAKSPPLRVHQRRTVVRVRPDTASRYGGVYRLLTAAECTPNSVGEDLDRLTWALLYDSIEAAKRAERVLQEANGFATA